MGAVRNFVSSLMSGAAGLPCDVASGDIAMLGDQPARSKDFPASPTSARVACLADVRPADAVELIWGSLCGRAREEQNREPQRTTKGLTGRDRIEAALFTPTRRRAPLPSGAEHLAEGFAVRLPAAAAKRSSVPEQPALAVEALSCDRMLLARCGLRRTVRQGEVP